TSDRPGVITCSLRTGSAQVGRQGSPLRHAETRTTRLRRGTGLQQGLQQVGETGFRCGEEADPATLGGGLDVCWSVIDVDNPAWLNVQRLFDVLKHTLIGFGVADARRVEDVIEHVPDA